MEYQGLGLALNLIMFLEVPWNYMKLKRNLQEHDFDLRPLGLVPWVRACFGFQGHLLLHSTLVNGGYAWVSLGFLLVILWAVLR
jgi:hypothetical protein